MNVEDEKRFASLCYQIFNTPTGQELMKYLDVMHNMPVADPGKRPNYAFFREGQNDMIRKLRGSIKQHAININNNKVEDV